MDSEYVIIGIFIGLVASCLFMLLILLFFVTQEKMLLIDCLNNGGHWLTNYAIGCTYPMG